MDLRTAIFVIIISLPFSLRAQDIKVKDGKVTVNNVAYCLYTEHYQPDETKNNELNAATKAGGEYETGNFSDATIYTPDSEAIIEIKARVLASPQNNYLKYYYAIMLLPTGREIDMQRKPYFIEYFLKDLVKQHLLVNNEWDYDAASRFYYAYTKKDGFIPAKTIALAASTNYNTQPEKSMDTLTGIPEVWLKENSIYHHDTLIGSYRRKAYNDKYRQMITTDGDDFFAIYNSNGQHIASLLIIKSRTQSYLWIGDAPQAMSLVSADKSLQKMMTVATKVLLQKQVL